jgi:hypothetical protein
MVSLRQPDLRKALVEMTKNNTRCKRVDASEIVGDNGPRSKASILMARVMLDAGDIVLHRAAFIFGSHPNIRARRQLQFYRRRSDLSAAMLMRLRKHASRHLKSGQGFRVNDLYPRSPISLRIHLVPRMPLERRKKIVATGREASGFFVVEDDPYGGESQAYAAKPLPPLITTAKSIPGRL